MEAWRNIGVGNRVLVERAISETEQSLVGRSFRVIRIASTGYAVIRDEHGSWHVHPECLSLNCCLDPHVRGGKCENCGTWIDD